MIKATISIYNTVPYITIRLFNDNNFIGIFYIKYDKTIESPKLYNDYYHIKLDNSQNLYVDMYEIYKENEVGNMILIKQESI